MTEATDRTVALRRAVEAIRARTTAEPEYAIILGTGLGRLAEEISAEATLSYAEIPGFPLSTVETHTGRLIFGQLEGRPVVAMQGRFHRYEGYSLQEVTFPVRIMRLLGARTIIVSNVSGGMQSLWRPGNLVLIDDHLNLLGESPLTGPNQEDLGPRFPDMTEPYDRGLMALAQDAALELGITLRSGVYAAVCGPNLETRAEYRMLRRMGADVVGMSTVPEVIVARHMDMRVLGLSIITDECLPDALQPADIDAIIETARTAEPRLTALIRRVLQLDAGATKRKS